MPLIQDIQTKQISKPVLLNFMTSREISRRLAVEVIQVTLILDNGFMQSAEVVAPLYICGETPEKSISALERVKSELIGIELLRHRVITNILDGYRDETSSAMAGVEIAIWKCISQITQTPLWLLWGGATQEVITDFTIALNGDFAAELDAAVNSGFSTVKIKMGILGKERELSALRHLYHCHPEVTLRVDANQAFQPDEALEIIDNIQNMGFQLELMEQPTPANDLQALRRVTENSPVPIIADESVRTFADALRICEEGAAHGYNIKLMKSGISQAMSIIALAKATDMRLMLGCMLEGASNIEVSLAFACGTGAFDYVDLDSFMFVNDDGSQANFITDGNCLRIQIE